MRKARSGGDCWTILIDSWNNKKRCNTPTYLLCQQVGISQSVSVRRYMLKNLSASCNNKSVVIHRVSVPQFLCIKWAKWTGLLVCQANSVWGIKTLVYEVFRYQCMWPEATSVWGLQLLVYVALSYLCTRPSAPIVWGLKLLEHESLSYWCMRP